MFCRRARLRRAGPAGRAASIIPNLAREQRGSGVSQDAERGVFPLVEVELHVDVGQDLIPNKVGIRDLTVLCLRRY